MKQGSINNYFKRQLDDNGEGTSKRNKHIESSQVPQPYEPSQKPEVRQDPQPNEPTQRPRAPQGPQPNEPSKIPQVPNTFDLNDLPSDSGDWPKITSYHPNQRDEIRRAYLTKGPCQPKGHTFESKLVGKKLRHFVVEWFVEFPWLEYIIKKNKAYCLCCYLFGDMVGEQGGRDAFTTEGFEPWSKKEAFRKHMGSIQSYHQKAQEKYDFLLRKNQSLISPTIQKDIVNCFSKEIIKSICDEIGKDVFGILIDESSDISKQEQMTIVLRYVDQLGIVKERSIGVVHVLDTSSLTLKAAIDSVFTDNNLSMAQVRGQGYNGASNMSGAFNGLKSLILKENSSAHYIHCFAHQLQLVVVVVAKKHNDVEEFFEQLALVVTVVCGSCKRKDMIREMQKERVESEIAIGETETGRGLNREISLARAGDTRWGSNNCKLDEFVC
ncbi:hypothetical protein Lser_V15G40243 [Lactuca serriola]